MRGGQNRRTLFLDANSLIYLVQRSPNAEMLEQVMSEYDFLSTSVLSRFFAHNFCTFTKFNTGKDYFRELHFIYEDTQLLEISFDLFQTADSILKGKDFEDALQVATAIHNKSDCILTSDKGMYESYSNLIKIIYVSKTGERDINEKNPLSFVNHCL